MDMVGMALTSVLNSQDFPSITSWGVRFELDGKVVGGSMPLITSNISTSLTFNLSPGLEAMLNKRYNKHNASFLSAMAPSMLELPGDRTLMVLRVWIRKEAHLANQMTENSLFVRIYDRMLNPLEPGRFIGFPVPQGPNSGPKDPRVVQFQNKIMILFDMLNSVDKHHHMYMWNYEEESLTKLRLFDHGREVKLSGWEKNWCPLVINDQLYLFYNIDPMTVLKCNISGVCNVVQNTPVAKDQNIEVFLRGGTPFVLYKYPYYIGVAHSKNMYCDRARPMYRAHIVVVSVQPTFRLVYTSDNLRFNEKILALKPKPQLIFDKYLYPISLVLRNDDIADVGMHLNDEAALILRLQGLTKLMSDVIEADSKSHFPHAPAAGIVQNYVEDRLKMECRRQRLYLYGIE